MSRLTLFFPFFILVVTSFHCFNFLFYFIVSTSSILGCNFWISVATRKILGFPKQLNSQKFQFIQIQSRQIQLNSSSSCKYSTKSSTMHHIQNLSTRTKSNSPKPSIMPYQKQNLNKIKKSILPLFVSDADWKLDCRCSPFCTFFIVLQKLTKIFTYSSINNK